ncbi:C40 family peptidase [Flavobacterium humi]|uniref:NlpC/P60 family protein n=1 Tax=Flavobacterium humi TaxID=2562683 RepID=A0A4Z0L547_9FLAO|nr:C40 family peptidase [Flavobacterium humi]TGD57352.1 NlpC/P60 family protein [Flavobacterium humi]
MTYKTLFAFFAIAILLSSCKTGSSIVTSKSEAQKRGIYKDPHGKISSGKSAGEKSKNATNRESATSEKLIRTATHYLGVKYKTAGTTEEGMDCSGLMIATFNNFNIKLPRTSNEMSKTGEEIDKSEAKKGDLIFFRTNGKSVINHVGMITEINDDEIKFIHSSTQKGVIISSTKESYYARTFAQINRIL